MVRVARLQRVALVVCLLGSAGCLGTGVPRTPPVACDVDTFDDALVGDPEACPLTRWIGETSLPECPTPASTDWQASALFPVDGSQANLRVPDPRYGGFCVYERTVPGTVSVEDLCGLPDDGPQGTVPAGQWLERDCQVVAPAAGLEPLLADQAESRRAALASWLEVASPPLQPSPGLTPPVVAIIDSVGDGDSVSMPDSAFHGLAVEGVARQVACQGNADTCLATFERFQALESSDAPSKAPTGNLSFGFQATGLARAIHRARRDWRQKLSAAAGDGPPAPPGMVLNLSLGWERRYSGAFPSLPTAGLPRRAARAVLAALRHASCDGILVFAAAGNPSWGPTPTAEPIFPAAWATEPALTAAQCECLDKCADYADCGTCFALVQGGAPPEPLLHAVGAVDERDEPLAEARSKGRPVLTAPGFLIAAPLPDAPGAFGISSADPLILPIMTGTSMSTAAVSGVAAATWAVGAQARPGFSRAEVVQAMTDAAHRLDLGPADFCHGGGSCDESRRVSLCGSLVNAGGLADTAYGLACDAMLTEPGSRTEQLDWPSGLEDDLLAPTSSPASGPVVGAWTSSASPGAATSPNARYEDAFVRPWEIVTQPPRDPCGACKMALSVNGAATRASVTIRTADWVSSYSLAETTLRVLFRDGSSKSFDLQSRLGSQPMRSEETYQITDIPLSSSAVSSATLSWKGSINGTDYSVTSQVGLGR